LEPPAPGKLSVELPRQITRLRRTNEDDRQERAALERDEATAILTTLGEPRTGRGVRD
jgi:hypothetical protein